MENLSRLARQRRNKDIAETAASDAEILSRDKNKLGIIDYLVRRPQAEKRQEQRQAAAIPEASVGVPAALAAPEGAYLPTFTEATGVRVPSMQELETTLDADVASKQRSQAIADTQQRAATRRLLGDVDTSDIEAERRILTELAGGDLRSGISDRLDDKAAARRKAALEAMKAIDTDTYRTALTDTERKRVDALIGKYSGEAERNTLTDVEKELLNMARLLADPTNRGNEALKEQYGYLRNLADQQRAGVRGMAEGGEVGGEYMPQPEPAIALETGDYIVPVEAMRFYGRKFFEDLIAKAEDAE